MKIKKTHITASTRIVAAERDFEEDVSDGELLDDDDGLEDSVDDLADQVEYRRR